MAKFLYSLITDRKVYRQPLEEVASRAEDAGVDYFQLREKDLSPAHLLKIAAKIRPILKRTRLIINGQTDVAIASGADGVHLQVDNLPVKSVRAAFANLLIGYSAHTREEMRMAESEGADYVFISPVFPPRSKSTMLKPIEPDVLSDWIAGLRIPVFGLGGATPENLEILRRAGCAGAASISLFVENYHFTAKGMVTGC